MDQIQHLLFSNLILSPFLSDFLSVRSFLDHNRIFEPTKPFKVNRPISESTGAYSNKGVLISSQEITFNLINHFKKWQPYISKFGLIILELHTISPKLTFKNIGKTIATAYDATHGYTDQYIIEHSCFINAAKHAGLAPIPKHTFKFPDNNITTVSIQLLRTMK